MQIGQALGFQADRRRAKALKKAPAQLLRLNEGQPDENTPHLVLSTMQRLIRLTLVWVSIFFKFIWIADMSSD